MGWLAGWLAGWRVLSCCMLQMVKADAGGGGGGAGAVEVNRSVDYQDLSRKENVSLP